MSSNPTRSSKHDKVLRQKSERMLGASGTDIDTMSREDIRNLVYEFQVYQIELELQNEELRIAQHQLAVSLDRYAQLYDYAPIGFLTLDQQGVIIKANLKAAKILGIDSAQLSGRKLVEFIHLEDQDKFYLYSRESLTASQKNTVEFRIKTREDHPVFVEIRSTLNLFEEQGPRVLMTISDISGRRRAEAIIQSLNDQLQQKVCSQTNELMLANRQLQQKVEELACSKRELLDREAKLNSIFNAAVEGIITISEHGIIESVNAAVTAIFGYEKQELIGRNIKVLMPPNQGERHGNYLMNYLKTNKRHIIGRVRELHGRHKDGTLIPIDLSVAEYEIDQKRYYTGLLRDVSERKLKEQKDKEHLSELAHVTRLGLMGEMASGIAHEVNQPLTAIANYTQVCLNLASSQEVDRVKLLETLQKTHQQALKAGQIIHRMRDFVRSRKIHRTKVDINHLVITAMALCEAECKQLQIQHKTELSASLPMAYVDYVQIEQVLLNLMRNSVEALHAMPDGQCKQLIIQTYLNEKNQIEVRVKDNGAGLDDSQQSEVLKPFYTTKESGMGMGLSISRSIVEAHNGFLRFNSKKGKGSTFYFTLPVN
ncbi:MAG: PAS domain-containing sensor histidine kinase [Gammaproteobacteria bacterium]